MRLDRGPRGAVGALILVGALLAAGPVRADLPALGTPAPDFSLPTTSGGTFRLADQLGRHNVVIALLLETYCPYCQRHVAALHAQRAKWAADYDAEVVFVKPDTLEAIQKFSAGMKTDQLPPLVVDSEKVVPKAYGVGMFQFHGGRRYLPATIIVDKAGLVRYTYASRSNADRPSLDALTTELKKLPGHADLAEGQPLPAFALPNQDGAIQRSADLLGKPLVLTFYPKDMTSGCTKEACSLRDNHNELVGTGAAVFGVSVDSPASHKAFIAKENLNYPLLSDEGKGYTRWLGLLSASGMANRVTIVVDKRGVVRKIDRQVKVASHGADLLPLLKQLAAE